MTTRQTPDAVREAYMQGQVDMRERAAQVCDQRGAEEQEAFGLVRGTQNYFRARNAVRDLEIAALDSRAGDAGEGLDDYRGWKIEHNPPPIPTRNFDWTATHPGYDGEGDNRQVWGASWDAVRAEIDDWFEQNAAMAESKAHYEGGKA